MDKSSMIEALVNHYSGGNQAQFAAKLGLPAQNISAWIKRGTFNAELLFSKCEGISADWLLSGEGEMLRSVSKQQTVDNNISMPYKELINLCKSLIENFQQRDEVMGKLVSMVKGL